MHSSSAAVLLFGDVGRCAAGMLTAPCCAPDFPPELVVYDRPVPGIPTVVWLFPVVLTVCFRPFGPKLMLALFFVQVYPDTRGHLKAASKPCTHAFPSYVRFLAFSYLWHNITTPKLVKSILHSHL